MLIRNNSAAPVILNLRDGKAYTVEANGATISLPDSYTALLDDNASTIALFNSGVLTALTDAGAPFPNFPSSVSAADSRAGKTFALNGLYGANGTPTLTGDAVVAVRGAAGQRQPRMSQITDGIRMPNTINPAFQQMLARSRYTVLAPGVTQIQARFPAFACVSNNGGLEEGVLATATIQVYLVVGGANSSGAISGGAIYPVTFGGQSSIVIPAGGMSELHDPIFVSAPKGTRVWYQVRFESTGGIVFEDGSSGRESGDAANGEQFRYAASGLDLTQVSSMGAWTGGSAGPNLHYGPCAIVSTTSCPAVYYVGTSIDMGFRSSANNRGNKGMLAAPMAAASIPHINVAHAGSKMTQWAVPSTRTQRTRLMEYCTHVYTGHGVNELLESGAVGNSEMLARYAAHLATFRSDMPVIMQTVATRTTGAWTAADGSDQAAYTSASFNTRRQALNTLIRSGGVPGFAAYIDVAAACCLPGASDGLWYADGSANYMFGPYTPADGLHPGTQGEVRAAASGLLDISQWVR